MTNTTDNTTELKSWRMAMIALGVLILCSCRGPVGAQLHGGDPIANQLQSPHTIFPESDSRFPIPEPRSPTDEYLRAGGDNGLPAAVTENTEVMGREPEDCIAHFDTLDGRTMVEPSNRVHIYSPRFGAVRQVAGLVANERVSRAAAVHMPEKLLSPTTTQPVAVGKQNVQADRQVSARPAGIFRTRQGDGVMSTTNKAREFEQDSFLPYENVKIIREGTFERSETAQLERIVDAAAAWAGNQAVQVVIDEQVAVAEVADQSALGTFTFKAPPGEPRLRVIKVADQQCAKPGDEVAFTIRFDNIGNQQLGNVTIIDNLTTRLEYVADSAQCSLDAEFSTEPNSGGSLVVRCEIAEPIESGDGGVIRFRCRVR